jgi:hypothetical protein
MIPTTQTGSATVMSHDFQNKSVGIDKSSISFILQILRNNIYSNKVAAVVREYVSNSRDEHIRLGKLDVPIEINTPSNMCPEFSVRDFGRGLTKDQVFHFFGSYGTSDKRDTNDLVGMMGIGCFAGFCYSNCFTITSFFNGQKFIFSNVIDSANQDGNLVLMDETETDEPNGVMITVPVKNQDFRNFSDEVNKFVKYVKYPYKINGVLGKYFNQEFFNKDWAPANESIVVMGGVPYPFKSSDSPSSYHDSTPKIVLYFNIGELEVSASREALQYTDKTIKNLKAKIDRVKQEIVGTFKTKTFAIPPEFIKFFEEIKDNGGGYVSSVAWKAVQDGTLNFNGVNLTKSQNIPTITDKLGVTLSAFEMSRIKLHHQKDLKTGLNKYKYVRNTHIEMWEQFYVIDDLPSATGRRLKLSNFININGKGFKLLRFANKADEVIFAQLVGMKNLDWIPRLSTIAPDPNFIKGARVKRGFHAFVIDSYGIERNSAISSKIEEIPSSGNFYYNFGYRRTIRGSSKIEMANSYLLGQKNWGNWFCKYFGVDRVYVIPDNETARKAIAKIGPRAIPLTEEVTNVHSKMKGHEGIKKIAQMGHFNSHYKSIKDSVNIFMQKSIEFFNTENEYAKIFKPNEIELAKAVSGIVPDRSLVVTFDLIEPDIKHKKEVLDDLAFLKYLDVHACKRDGAAAAQIIKILERKLDKINLAILT